MITALELKNFKSIKSKYFHLRNLNVIMGMNGQGKSSFIQSLLLLRQSDSLQKGILKLNGGDNGIINIGSTKDTLYQYAKETDNLSYKLLINDTDEIFIDTDYIPEADFFKIKNDDHVSNLFLSTSLSKEPLFTNRFQYLHAQRVEPEEANKASFSAVMIEDDLGKYGQYTAHYIEQHGSRQINFSNLRHPKSFSIDPVTGKELIKQSLLDQINFWLGEISPGVSVKVQKITNELVLLGYEFEQVGFGYTNQFKPQNVGFGISYSLHVITSILKAREGDLIIIENPESHIHPRGQAELGKLIALASLNSIQIVIETHSDHILNGIRVAVKENKELSNRTILFYFEKVIAETEQYSTITDIEIDQYGTLSDYPDNLLEEWGNQLSKLI